MICGMPRTLGDAEVRTTMGGTMPARPDQTIVLDRATGRDVPFHYAGLTL